MSGDGTSLGSLTKMSSVMPGLEVNVTGACGVKGSGLGAIDRVRVEAFEPQK